MWDDNMIAVASVLFGKHDETESKAGSGDSSRMGTIATGMCGCYFHPLPYCLMLLNAVDKETFIWLNIACKVVSKAGS